MLIVAADHGWVERHADLRDDGWYCKRTGRAIMVSVIGRSIHQFPRQMAGDGRVIPVGHLHCPGCSPDWQPPEYGKPITESELAETSE